MRKRITLIAMFLILGAIVNVAVAWGCAAWAPRSHTFGVPLRFSSREILMWWEEHAPHNCPRPLTQTETELSGETNKAARWHGFGLEGFSASDLQDGAAHVGFHHQLGWPYRVMTSNVWNSNTGSGFAQIVEDGWRVPNSRTLPCRNLPLRPLWPGFAINTIFYAAILYVLFFAPGSVRRMIRRRRGLCPACGYPVGTSPVCTECGMKVEGIMPRRGNGM